MKDGSEGGGEGGEGGRRRQHLAPWFELGTRCQELWQLDVSQEDGHDD